MGNKVAVIMRKAPYGTVYPAEGFRSIMGIGVFELEMSVIFIDDGVYVLTQGQHPEALEMKPLGDGFPMLKDFGVNNFYVHDESLAERGLSPEDLVMEAEVVDSAGINKLLESAGIVLPF